MGRGVIDPSEPMVTAWDDGLLRGDGCFDAIRLVRDGSGVRVDHRAEHLARFERSATALGIRVDLSAWDGLIDDAASQWQAPGEASIKIVTTRGPIGAGSPTSFLTITELPPSVHQDRQGLAVATLTRGYAASGFDQAPWLLGGVKALAYAVNMAASRHAHALGAGDALFVSSDGFALEAPTAALLWWADGALWTTRTADTGVLRSVTAEALLAEADQRGWQTGTGLIRPAELTSAWLASAVRGVCPITAIDGRSLDVDMSLTATMRSMVGF